MTAINKHVNIKLKMQHFALSDFVLKELFKQVLPSPDTHRPKHGSAFSCFIIQFIQQTKLTKNGISLKLRIEKK